MESADRRFVAAYLEQSAAAMSSFAGDAAAHAVLADMATRTIAAFRAGGKLLLAGNGGSAGDAQHIATEFTGRLMYDRDPLPAIALTTDSSALTAIGNDYGFDDIFERQVRALGRSGDVFLGISTSGNSVNIVRALQVARARGVLTFGFTGPGGGRMAPLCDLTFRSPGSMTSLIQQVHITAAHLFCALIERAMFPMQDEAVA